MSGASAVNLKRVTLELGGKSPLVIFNDADGMYTKYLKPAGILIFTSVSSLIIKTVILIKFIKILVEKAAEIAHGAVFANAGQSCVAATRTYVQSGIYDAFVAKAAEIAKKRSVGNSFTDVEQGPQVI